MKINAEIIAKRERHLRKLEVDCRIDELHRRLKEFKSAPGLQSFRRQWQAELVALRNQQVDLLEGKLPAKVNAGRGQRERAAFTK